VAAGRDGDGDKADAPALPEGISAFIAGVLNQLSLSSWLPAAFLTAALTIVLQFRSQRSVSLPVAVAAITSDPWRFVLLAVPTLVIAALVTQAFSFEAIRTLEGYWRRRGAVEWLRTQMIRRHVRRKRALERRREHAARHAFYQARPRMLKAYSYAIVDALEADLLGIAPPKLRRRDQAIAERMGWRAQCNAWDLARVDHLLSAEDDYPITSRVLPTKLGNVIRATEDALRHADNDVEGFALRRRGLVSPRIQQQHDQFRTRLDMYCTLVFVASSLVIASLALLLGRVDSVGLLVLEALFLSIALTSYNAAIASARGYCAALRQMDEASGETAAGQDPS
jgi:hypothetical protein